MRRLERAVVALEKQLRAAKTELRAQKKRLSRRRALAPRSCPLCGSMFRAPQARTCVTCRTEGRRVAEIIQNAIRALAGVPLNVRWSDYVMRPLTADELRGVYDDEAFQREHAALSPWLRFKK